MLNSAILRAATDSGPPSNTQLVERFKTLYPNSNIEHVNPSPIAGLFEVVAGENVFYATADGKHVVFGHIYDVEKQRDLTADIKQQIMPASRDVEATSSSNIAFAALPLVDAITTVRGNGSRKLVVFTDPLCGYCRLLDQNLAEIGDVTQYTFVVSILPAQSSRDKLQIDRMAGCGEDPRDCRDKVARNTALFQKLGFQGTPMLVRADGVVRAGAIETNELVQWLGQSTRLANGNTAVPTTQTKQLKTNRNDSR